MNTTITTTYITIFSSAKKLTVAECSIAGVSQMHSENAYLCRLSREFSHRGVLSVTPKQLVS